MKKQKLRKAGGSQQKQQKSDCGLIYLARIVLAIALLALLGIIIQTNFFLNLNNKLF